MMIIRYFVFTSIIFLLVSSLWVVPVKAQVVENYISKYKPLASELSDEYGIPVSIILGIAIVESSAGKGPAVKNLNNHFGIVGKNHLVAKGKHKSRYKQYSCAEDSYRDFCKMVSHKKYYQKIKCKSDPRIWVKAMSKAHYSELPVVWQKKILSAIAHYDLGTL